MPDARQRNVRSKTAGESDRGDASVLDKRDGTTLGRRYVLAERVLKELRLLIASGGLAPGERLVEREIAERLGTSRGPVRDAIRALEHEGLVETRAYAGACVSEIDRAEIDEIVALRRQVEYFAIAGAALRASQADIEELRTIASNMRAAFDDRERVLQLDFDFHLAITKASKHTTLVVVMRTLLPRLLILFYPQIRQSYDAASFERLHLDLVDPIERRDVSGALEAIDAHMNAFYVDLELRLDGAAAHEPPEYLGAFPLARPTLVERRRGPG